MNEVVTNRKSRQINLSTLLLIVAVVAIGIAWYRTRTQIQNLELSIESMESITRDLQVVDRSKIAAITRLPTLVGELIYDVYIPGPEDATVSGSRSSSANATHQLCLALEEISDRRTPAKAQSFELAPGIHSIQLREQKIPQADAKEQFEIDVLVDGEVVIHAVRPVSWNSSKGWTGSGTITKTQSFTIGQAVVLHRRRFHQALANGVSKSPPPDKGANGIELWIQSATGNPN